MLQRWLWAMLVYVWCTGIQAINNTANPIAQEDLNPWGTIQRKQLKRTCSKLYLHSHWQKSWNSTNSPSSTEDKDTENRLVRPPHAHLGSPRPFIHTHSGAINNTPHNTKAPTKAFIPGFNWNRTRKIHRREHRDADNVKRKTRHEKEGRREKYTQ